MTLFVGCACVWFREPHHHGGIGDKEKGSDRGGETERKRSKEVHCVLFH